MAWPEGQSLRFNFRHQKTPFLALTLEDVNIWLVIPSYHLKISFLMTSLGSDYFFRKVRKFLPDSERDRKLIFMWQLKIISYFNISENTVRKFITTLYQIKNLSHLVSSLLIAPGFLYTHICLTKIYYAEQGQWSNF